MAAKKEAAKARAGKKLVLSVAEGFLPPNPLPFCPPSLSDSNFSVATEFRANRVGASPLIKNHSDFPILQSTIVHPFPCLVSNKGRAFFLISSTSSGVNPTIFTFLTNSEGSINSESLTPLVRYFLASSRGTSI